MLKKNTVVSIAIAVAVGLLAGCDRQPPQTNTEPPVKPETQSPAAPPTPPRANDPRSQVTANRIDMYVADGRVQNWEGIGTRDGDRLATNATNGFLMFGPKVPFDAGSYKVALYGENLKIAADDSIKFDVTSNEGKQVYATHTLDQTASVQSGAALAEFTFVLPEAVTDLEVRAYVTSGSQVTLTRYEVTPATP